MSVPTALGIAALLWLLGSVAATLAATPGPGAPSPAPRRNWRQPVARLLYRSCLPLTVLRLPYAVLPHLAKVAFLLVTGGFGDRWWNRRPVQLVRTLGDWVNLALTGWVLFRLTDADRFGAAGVARAVAVAVTAAEVLRLVAEKGQMLFSAGWQLLPHRGLAALLGPASGSDSLVDRYRWYYALDDGSRAAQAHRRLVARSERDPATAVRLAYTTGVLLVDPDHPLWSGVVRDVASGQVLAHPRWTADPGLLMGQLLRRGPWIFDPRLCPRPLRYRTGSNVAMTMIVLANADLLGAYGIYQWGNQVKVARYEIFHHACRALGLGSEQVLADDGSFDFTPPDLRLLRRLLGVRPERRRPLRTDAEVLEALRREPDQRDPAAIARRYCYPERYVREVLLPLAGGEGDPG